ncbi:uncharacterized protein BXZ73DRAFT_99794 [Epithele typhae]|uniref:uncharacterized protein n=1 Tax=Epithele typhae TaxID=378194 RepID=UPI002008964F|nr:uncharacterized protein BXZ73DRAFT_99794 [Epithele typhae]KAH9939121.1 hypothetical protein BXZ73DRAFT_99794 [Epithele typhae]
MTQSSACGRTTVDTTPQGLIYGAPAHINASRLTNTLASSSPVPGHTAVETTHHPQRPDACRPVDHPPSTLRSCMPLWLSRPQRSAVRRTVPTPSTHSPLSDIIHEPVSGRVQTNQDAYRYSQCPSLSPGPERDADQSVLTPTTQNVQHTLALERDHSLSQNPTNITRTAVPIGRPPFHYSSNSLASAGYAHPASSQSVQRTRSLTRAYDWTLPALTTTHPHGAETSSQGIPFTAGDVSARVPQPHADLLHVVRARQTQYEPARVRAQAEPARVVERPADLV